MKIAGSYASLLRGVSQQPPEVRAAGQHTEQVNMLSDPVVGLARRRGTLLQGASFVPVDGSVTAYDVEATGSGYRKLEHTTDGRDYVILLRDEPQGGVFVGTSMPPIMCWDPITKTFLGVSWSISGGSWQSNVRALGISAAVSVGQYVLFARRNQPCSLTTTLRWNQPGYKKAVVWIRGGTYSRVYGITVDGGTYTYTTAPSTWTGPPSAEEMIQPSKIASELAALMVANGFTGVQNNGSHLCFDLPATGDVSTSDGGDGSLMRSAGLELDDVAKLPLMGVHGQIVKIKPAADSWFYVQANGKANTGGSLQEVIWRECSGEQQGEVLTGLGVARVYDGTLYVGVMNPSDPTGLGHMPGGAGTNPTMTPSIAGDRALNPPHRWMNNRIDYLGLFQDRLLVGSGAALSVSGAGDYLNFFRSTMTTVPAMDGFEVIAQGGEDDVLRHSVTYNKNLVIFGDKRQYLIPGTTAFTPVAPNMSIMTVYANGAECKPVAAGGQIFYARNREGWAGVHQIQPGQYVDSAESFPASAQVGAYIPAPAVDIEAIPGVPAMLAVRSRASPRTIYVFSYVDLPDGRKQDAWMKWEFHRNCGVLMAMHSTPAGLLLFWARNATTSGIVYRVVDLLPLSTGDNTKPYLDSMRDRLSVGTAWPGNNGVWYSGGSGDTWGWAEAFDSSPNSGTRFLVGAAFEATAERAALEALPEATTAIDPARNLWVGLNYPAYVVPTNPFARDGQGNVVTNGRTTITKLVLKVRNSAGAAWEITAGGLTKAALFIGNVIGVLATVGKVPISSGTVSIPVGKETREYSIKIAARKWYPLNITGIEWTGQSFNRTARASSGG